ncbi:hypothetical protein Pse7367_1817 [Thalassoporum mexicanum PCC 7367]|uniref:SPOR domain-containing protein n=1 Tax=Thalassoporum mexicanum TaxID=3457544 RepID=UPI00029FE4C2|nr:SPOR domain-containing protein [Pseudanabaena sp. PCC 7367]AFY70094.1 hypothetical protein Pse7367_1817 [Pseudanabaena sp. PCC 7367]
MAKLSNHTSKLSIGILTAIATTCGLGIIAVPNSIAQAPISTNSTSNQYVVYMPAGTTNLQQVRTVVPDAFNSSLSNGERVVQIGRFNNLNLAQQRMAELQQQGIAAQVATVPYRAPAPVAPVATVNDPFVDTFSNPVPIASAPTTPFPNSNSAIVTAPPPPTGAPTTFGNDPFINPPTVGTAPGEVIEITRAPQPITPSPTIVEPIPTPPGTPEITSVSSAVPNNRYVVIVPSSVDSVLAEVRTIVPSAKFTVSRMGTFIEVQKYPDRRSADSLNRTLRNQGFDARVIYL